MNLPIVLIYFYFRKEKKNLPPGEPRKQCLGEVLQGKSEFKRSTELIYYSFWNLMENFIFALYYISKVNMWSGCCCKTIPPAWPLRKDLFCAASLL